MSFPNLPTLPPFPSLEQIEEYIFSIEDYLVSQLPPQLSEGFQKVYADLRRYGPPSFPEIAVPGFGGYIQVPAPPPPPPPKAASELVADWITSHKWPLIVTLLAGAGIVGYGAMNFHKFKRIQNRIRANHNARQRYRGRAGKEKVISSLPSERRDVIVVLGADSIPYGAAFVYDLQSRGYIIIATVSSNDSVDEFELAGQGYVRALVLDPNQPDSIPTFIHTLASTISLRFPVAAGDPYMPMSSSPSASSPPPHLTSIISLLSLASPSPSPLSSQTLTESYLPHLVSTTLTPLSFVQSALPLFKYSKNPTSVSDLSTVHSGSVVICVPAFARVGAIGSAAVGMAGSALVRGAEVLRREISLSEDEDVKNLRVILLDVGNIHNHGDPDNESGEAKDGRKPSDVKVLTETYLSVLRAGKITPERRWLDKLRQWWWSGRHSVGAGATTYALASYLPSRVLDWLLYLPYQFSTIRATLAPVSPFALPPPPGSLVHSLAKPTPNVADVTETPEHEEKDDVSSGPSSAMYSANISEAGDGAHEETGESWVKLKDEAAAHDGG